MGSPSPPGQPDTNTQAPGTNPDPVLLTVEEAARRLSIGRTTMYALLKDGRINSVRVGRLRRIPAEDLAEYTARLVAEQHVA